MKNKIVLSIVMLMLVVPIMGCKTSSTQRPPQEVIVDFIKPLVTVACTAVLESSVSPEERVNIAKQIFDVSSVIEAFSQGETPTPESLKALLEHYLPKQAKYANLIGTLKDIYATQFGKIGGDAKLAVKYLNQIAAGCKEASQAYLPQ